MNEWELIGRVIAQMNDYGFVLTLKQMVNAEDGVIRWRAAFFPMIITESNAMFQFDYWAIEDVAIEAVKHAAAKRMIMHWMEHEYGKLLDEGAAALPA